MGRKRPRDRPPDRIMLLVAAAAVAAASALNGLWSEQDELLLGSAALMAIFTLAACVLRLRGRKRSRRHPGPESRRR